MVEQPLPPRAELLIFGVRRRRRKNCLVDAETKTGSDTKLAGLLPGPMPLGLTWSGLVRRCHALLHSFQSRKLRSKRLGGRQAVHEICGSRTMEEEGINQTIKSQI